MYKLHLILKYLRKRRIAWVSLVAVMLCTTMVLVVISVMGGWLRMFREQFHSLSGDVIIRGRSQLVGFPHYERMIQRILREVPEAVAAAPVITTFGLVSINGTDPRGVQVVGYPPNIGQVNGFVRSLHLRSDRQELSFALWPDRQYPTSLPGSLEEIDPSQWPGMIVGSGVIGLRKDRNGAIHRPDWLYSSYIDLTVLPIPEGGAALANPLTGSERAVFWLVDDSRTKVYIVDSSNVYVSFDVLQDLLRMRGGSGRPARTSEVQVALRPGADVNAARDRIERVAHAVMLESADGEDRAFYEAQRRELDEARRRLQELRRRGAGGIELEEARRREAIAADNLERFFRFQVLTWEQVHASFIGAVEKEKGLVTILFGMISIVAVGLIFCIFYMIVVEKTRDIGIIKSVGATSSGVAAIFLGYGASIGLAGAAAGFVTAWLIVRYINELHDMLGKAGIVVWNPEIYLFDTIPNTMNPPEVAAILVVAVVASVLGALLPALRAARLHPVEALRWE